MATNVIVTDLSNLQATKSQIIAALAAETLYQSIHGPRDDYSIDGESHTWTSWRDGCGRLIDLLNHLIQAENPYILTTRMRS